MVRETTTLTASSGQGRGRTGTSCHILFIIDQLMTPLGGAEHILLKTATQLPAPFRGSILTFASNLSTHEVASIPCPLHVFPLKRSYDLNAARMALRLIRLIRSENVRIVHTFFESSDLWAGSIARLATSAKLVTSRRDMGILRSTKHQIAYRLLAPLSHKVIAVSEEVRQYVIAADRLPPEKVETIYNGLEMPQAAAFADIACLRKKLGVAEDDVLITSIGNLRRVKGFDILIRAAETVCARFPQARFLIAGGVAEPGCERELQHMVKAHGVSKTFMFVGHWEDVFSLLGASDIFVLPSRSEGFSNALLEGMAAGLPCVATRVGGNAEAIENGVGGFLVDPEDVSALAERICWLLQNPQQRRVLGAAARARAEKNFSLQAMLDRLATVYEGLL